MRRNVMRYAYRVIHSAIPHCLINFGNVEDLGRGGNGNSQVEIVLQS